MITELIIQVKISYVVAVEANVIESAKFYLEYFFLVIVHMIVLFNPLHLFACIE